MTRTESLYNLSQENELFIFLKYLPHAIMETVGKESLWKGEGRPPCNLFDILICLVIMHYFGKSLRRSMGIIRMCVTFAKIPIKIPCFKTLSNYRNNPHLRPYLDELITTTSEPLSLLEKDFSTDSSGSSTRSFSSYYNLRLKRRIRRRDHITVHVTTTRLLNAAAAVSVDVCQGKEGKYFEEHVKKLRKISNRFETGQVMVYMPLGKIAT